MFSDQVVELSLSESDDADKVSLTRSKSGDDDDDDEELQLSDESPIVDDLDLEELMKQKQLLQAKLQLTTSDIQSLSSSCSNENDVEIICLDDSSDETTTAAATFTAKRNVVLTSKSDEVSIA